MKKLLRVRTVILSDVHLGTSESKAREVNHFLRHTRSDKLILNGDIIDGWQLTRSGHWTNAHTRFVRIVLKKLEKKNTEVIYLRGNHDDILASFLPLAFENLRIVEEYIHEGPRGRYLVLHGDVFDTVTKNFVFLAHLGDWGYRLLLKLNRWYNLWRAWRGKEYWSLSKAIKARVKEAVSIPVIASGGLTNLDDVRKLADVESEGIEGAITGRAIYEGTLKFAEAQQLADELAARDD